MSANFPWGFGLPKVEGPDGDILLLDGGVLDNSGLDTLAVLFERMLYLAEHATGKDTPGLHERSRRLLNAIAPRGVVVLEIDSGAKPEAPGFITRGLSELLMPVHSLNTSAFARAVSASEANIQRINGVLEAWAQRMVATNTLFWPDPDVADDHCNLAEGDTPTNLDVIGTRVEHVVYALDTESIITSWALTPEQKAQVIARFLNEDATQRLELKDAYEDMRGESELMRMTARSALDSPELADLFETLAWDRRHLHSLKEASVAAETQRRSQSRSGGPVTTKDARVDEGWALIGTVYQGVWQSSAMPFGVTEDVWHDIATPFELHVTEPLLVRTSRPDLGNQGWSFPSGLVEVGGCVQVEETCRLSYLNAVACTEQTLVPEVPELVFARVKACPDAEVLDN